MTILKQHTTYAGHKVVGRLRTNHHEERVVCQVKYAIGKDVVLIVYNLKCPCIIIDV